MTATHPLATRAVLYRGGTSKALIVRAEDLPTADPAALDTWLRAVYGSPDPRQIDGVGGADALTSKFAVVGPPTRPDADVDYTFAQVGVSEPYVDRSIMCGNIASAIGPYAVEEGLVPAVEPETEVRIHNTNTGTVVTARVQVTGCRPCAVGDAVVDGVPGSAAPVLLDFAGAVGAKTGALLPTGSRRDRVELPGRAPLECSVVDVTGLFVFVRAADLGLTGAEDPRVLEGDREVLELLEAVRAEIAVRTGFATSATTALAQSPITPATVLVGPPADWTLYGSTRTRRSDEADLSARAGGLGIGISKAFPVSGSIATAVAAALPGTVVHDVVRPDPGDDPAPAWGIPRLAVGKSPTRRGAVVGARAVRIGHPSGVLTVHTELDGTHVHRAALVRTARRLFEGSVLAPPHAAPAPDTRAPDTRAPAPVPGTGAHDLPADDVPVPTVPTRTEDRSARPMPSPQLAVVDLTRPESFVPGVPHDTFDLLRRESPVHWFPTDTGTLSGGFWALTRHADIARVNRDPAAFTSSGGAMYPVDPRMNEMNASVLMYLDPPAHSRLRSLAVRSFSPRVVARFADWVSTIVDEALDRALGLGEFDFVDEVAAVIPALVVAQVMGVPEADRPMFVEVANVSFARELSPEHWQAYLAKVPGFFRYVLGLRELKRREPGTDVVTELVTAVPDGPPLTDLETASYLYLLLVAGFETTHTLMAQGMRLLLDEPDVAATARRYVADGRAAAVTDELLRLVTPAMQMARTAVRDVEVGGTPIRAGDMVTMWFTSGNRDPEVFADPHRFDPDRDNSRIQAFGGGGPHYCLGNHLARLEMRLLLEALVRRDVRLRPAGEPVRGFSTGINQLTALPVALG